MQNRQNELSDISIKHLKKWFPNSRKIIGSRSREIISSALGEPDPSGFLYNRISQLVKTSGLAEYLPDICLLEMKRYELFKKSEDRPKTAENVIINPDMLLLPVTWKNLPGLLIADASVHKKPEPAQAYVLMWRRPGSEVIECRDAGDDDLLALKLVAENLDFRQAAELGNVPLAKILAVYYRAIDIGLLIGPESKIKRDSILFDHNPGNKTYLSTDVFTLQWHITQACDLHCRHCYDRTDRRPLLLEEAVAVLDDFSDFTRAMHVRGHITFTGGNPLLYPRLSDLYQAASDRGFSLAILGNPTTSGIIDPLQQIQPMTHFQISLEGLKPYNDYIRGQGHFDKSIAFLEALKKKGIYSMVMLTLNRDNMGQILPLAEFLRDRADSFTFNRLAMVGEGQNLSLPKTDEYQAFLRTYLAAAESNPVISLKDNLINILKEQAGQTCSGGCTGHGCGAAFNFISLLADGEVHACRKFPSLIGNIHEKTFLEIYTSPETDRYRKGSLSCRECSLFIVCRGCPAVVFGMGLDWQKDRDPFCFLEKPGTRCS